MNNYFWTVINFFCSIIISIIGGMYKLQFYESLILGLISFVSLSLLQQLYSLTSLNERLLSLNKELSTLPIADEFKEIKINSTSDIFILIKELSKKVAKILGRNLNEDEMEKLCGLESLFYKQVFTEIKKCVSKVKELEDGNLEFNRDLRETNWRKIILAFDYTYKTTNILTNDDTFGRKGSGDPSYNLQKDSIEQRNCEIERIFIYKDRVELKKFKISIKDQLEAGIKVKIISMDRYNDPEIVALSKKLGSSDFAIVDDKYVYITVTSQDRKTTIYTGITKNSEKLKYAKDIYSSIIFKSDALSLSNIDSFIS